MNDKINDAAAGSDIENKLRAERINAIKNSVRKASASDKTEGMPSEAVTEIKAEKAAVSEWEAELAARIAKRVKTVKQNRELTTENILDELQAENADVNSVPEQNATADKNSIAAEEQAETAAEESEAETETSVKEKISDSEQSAEAVPEKKKSKKKKKKKTFKQRILGFFPQKGDSVGECIRKIVFLASVIAIIVCGYLVSDYYIDLWQSKKVNDEVMGVYWTYQSDTIEDKKPTSSVNDVDDEPVYYMLDGAKKLLDINSDVVGVINIPDTPVNNPVMQSDDNSKYLDRKINGEESRAGELFLDYRNHFDDVDEEGHLKEPNSDNLVIYGHNMNDEQMFGSLKYYHRNYDYYGKHPVIQLNSNYERYQYKIFAFFILDAEDKTETKYECWNKMYFNDEEDFYSFVNEAKRRTIRLNDVDVKYGDKLLTLSTCNTLLGDRGRLIIMARMVRDGEDPYEGTQDSIANPNIKWPSYYYDIRKNEKYDPDAEFVPYGPEKSDKAESDKSESEKTESDES